ncbi:hypothetical protein [Sorangium sp. So ce1389]|uniref:hypothetical protein n=1 Tax=Sorangium sp. So ce1389 TaxID=3133336 RepID=UPI003F5F0BA5
MHVAQAIYRELHGALLGYEGGSLYADVLAPWIEANAGERSWLRSFVSRRGSPVPVAESEDLWRLYALSRVNQVLLLRFQRGSADGSDWPGPPVSPDEYVGFAEALGLSVAQATSFSPFYHEIVEVEPADDRREPVSLLGYSWPCLMLGDMLFSRAGVRVRGGREIVRKDVAEASTLYWAYWRKSRPHADLSDGWGSNSQWRTSFRRDYRVGQALYYNVDGKHDLGVPEPTAEYDDGLTREERVELLTHRCFITTAKQHDDLYPYDDRLETEA